MSRASLHSLILVLLIWFAGLGAAVQFSKVAVFFADLELIYGAGQSNLALGFVVSLISFLGIVFGLAAGLIVARVGMRRMLLGGLFLGASVSLYQMTLPSLGWMLASRLMEGASHLVIVVAAPTLIAQVTMTRFLPLAMTLWSTFFGVAFVLTAWGGGPLASQYGLPGVFLVHAAWMAGVGAVLFWVLPKDTDIQITPRAGFLAQHWQIYRNPAKAAPALAWLCYTLTFVSLLTVLPPFIAAEHRSWAVGLMPLAGIVCSMTLGVALQKYVSPIVVVTVGFTIAAGVSVLLWILPGNPYAAVALFCALGLIQGANFSAIPYLNQSGEDRAHAQGAVAQMGNLGNTIGTPIALAMISQLGYSGLILFSLAAYGAGIAVHLGLARLRNRKSWQ